MISQEQIDNQKVIVKNYEKELLLYNNKVETLQKDAIPALEAEVKKYQNKIASTSEAFQVALDDLLRLEEEKNVNRIGEGIC
jgi:hypothetical protein